MSNRRGRSWPWVAMLCCFVYWLYVGLNSEMLIKFDAVAYGRLGQMIHEKGWIEYFRTGPNREPFYPFLISISMDIADWLSLSFRGVQKVMQFFFLFATQALSWTILGRLGVGNRLKTMTWLYIGFSPSLVNSPLSLFQEVATYPFVLGIVLLSTLSWKSIQQKSSVRRIVVLAGLSGVGFLGATLNRGVFNYVWYLFVIPYVFLLLRCLRTAEMRAAVRVVTYVLVCSVLFQSGVLAYRWMNKIHNGRFEFSDRYANLLYGNASRRVKEMTPRMWLAAVTSIPGHGSCRLFLSYEECKAVDFEVADGTFATELPKLLGDTPKGEVTEKTIGFARDKVLSNPIQYGVFMLIEAVKMFFWESTKIGNVAYPAALQAIFDHRIFRSLLRLVMSLMSLYSFFYLASRVVRYRSRIFSMKGEEQGEVVIAFFVVLVVSSYIGLLSFFSVLTRYALPIAPLYLIAMAYVTHIHFSEARHQKQRMHP